MEENEDASEVKIPDNQPRRFRWLPRLLLDVHLYGGLILLGLGLDRHFTGALEITLGLGLLSLFLLTVIRPALLHGSVKEEKAPRGPENSPIDHQPLRRDEA